MPGDSGGPARTARTTGKRRKKRGPRWRGRLSRALQVRPEPSLPGNGHGKAVSARAARWLVVGGTHCAQVFSAIFTITALKSASERCRHQQVCVALGGVDLRI